MYKRAWNETLIFKTTNNTTYVVYSCTVRNITVTMIPQRCSRLGPTYFTKTNNNSTYRPTKLAGRSEYQLIER